MPHLIGTHHAALRLATRTSELPAPSSHPFVRKRILDLGSGAHPFPHVGHGLRYLEGIRRKVTVDLPGGPPPEIPGEWSQVHVPMDLNRWEWHVPNADLDQRFDLIVALELIEHVENPWSLLRFCEERLAHGGAVIVSSPDITSQAARRHFKQHGTFPLFGEADIAGHGHITPILPHLFREMVTRAGLVIAEEAHNEPPKEWRQRASKAERQDVKERINVWRLERG